MSDGLSKAVLPSVSSLNGSSFIISSGPLLDEQIGTLNSHGGINCVGIVSKVAKGQFSNVKDTLESIQSGQKLALLVLKGFDSIDMRELCTLMAYDVFFFTTGYSFIGLPARQQQS